MYETVNRVVELFNLGRRQEAMLLASSVPPSAWAQAPDYCRAIEVIALCAAQELIQVDPCLLQQADTVEQFCQYLPPDNQRDLWLEVVTARLGRGDYPDALLAACHALAAQPENISAQALVAEAAALSGAVDAAVIFAKAAHGAINDGPLRERMSQIIALQEHSKIRHSIPGAFANALLQDAETSRTSSPGVFFYKKILASAGEDAAWQGLFDIGQCFGHQAHNGLAMTVFQHIADMVPNAGWAEQAYDECLARAEQWEAQVERRCRNMQTAMVDLMPPAEDTTSVWDLDAAQVSPSQVLAALRAHGLVLMRGLLDPVVIARVRDHLFANDPDRRFVKPSQDLPPDLLSALVPSFVAQIMQKLHLVGPDGATSHGRQIIPDALAAEDLLTTTFHQDAVVFYQPLINMWIPLTDCGDRAPGLAIIPESTRRIFSTRRVDRFSFENLSIQDPSFAYDDQDRASIKPVFQAGDVLFFLGTVPHRTHLIPSMTERRQSLELRFVTPGWIMESLALV